MRIDLSDSLVGGERCEMRELKLSACLSLLIKSVRSSLSSLCLRVCLCVRAWVRACVRAGVCVCVCVCVCVKQARQYLPVIPPFLCSFYYYLNILSQ